MLHLHTLGGLRLEGPDGPIAGAAARRRRPLAVLAAIAAAGQRGMSRDRLMGLFWPESDAESARHALAQSLYLLRRDLGADELLLAAGSDLRLNPAVIDSDIQSLFAALDTGDAPAAMAAYAGPFLEGFYLSGAPDFERWVEEERARLAGRFQSMLEREATQAEAAGDHGRAAELWQRVVASDPLAGRSVLRLMRALDASGQRAAALRQASIHAALVEAELGAGPDTPVLALARELRDAPLPAPIRTPSAAAPVAVAAPAPVAPPQRRWPLVVAAAAIIAFAAFVLAGIELGQRGAPPVVAVGMIESHLRADTAGLARALPDLVTTHLAQVPGLRVVSRARLLEVLGEAAQVMSPGGVATAARHAGATELIEGTLYPDSAGTRLDLRRVDLATGEMRGVVSVSGGSAESLVRRATAELASGYGLPGPSRSLGSVTSTSILARRFYEEGLRAFYAGDARAASGLFRVALAEDTTFAMAAFYLARTMTEAAADSAGGRWRTAIRLAERATDRERLLILAWGSLALNSAPGLAYAETLAVRYPDDLDAIRILGDLRFARGEFGAAADAFERLIVLDSAGRRGRAARCHACEGAAGAIWASLTGDSLARAERLAREVSRWPAAIGGGSGLLVTVLVRRGNIADAVAVARAAAAAEPQIAPEAVLLGGMQMAGEFAHVDSILSSQLAATQTPELRAGILDKLSKVHRESGRPRSALELALEVERIDAAYPSSDPKNPFGRLSRALAFLELGRHDPRAARAAAALFDSMAQTPAYDEPRMARHRAWMWTHVATALALAGDTAALPRIANRIRSVAERSSYGRDRRLPAYVTGLLLEARGDWEGARIAYTAAVWSPTENLVAAKLARASLRTGRPRDAVRVLQQYLRGPLDAANQYVARWEVHSLLGDAFEATGQPDSAKVHREWVGRALSEAEADYRRPDGR